LFANNAVVGIYPQGHRERTEEDETSLQASKFHTTVAYLHRRYVVPIVPVAMYGPVKGPKLPRSVLFCDPIYSEPIDEDNPDFNIAKHDTMAELHTSVNEGYKWLREWHLTEYPQPTRLQYIKRLGGAAASASFQA